MKNILFFVVLTISLTAYSQNTISIEGETYGVIDADTVLVTNNVMVPINSQLTISSGTIVKFMGYYSIDVRGSFQAIGTLSDTIVFTVKDTIGFYDTLQPYGGWNRIIINRPQGSSDSVIFDYCKFEFSKADSSLIGGGALLFNDETKVRISNSVFRENLAARNGGAIYFNSSKAKIVNCTFLENKSGTYAIWSYGGAVYGINSELSLIGCKFLKNRSSALGGAVALDSIAPIIINNIYEENHSGFGGAIVILRSPEGGKIVGSLFDNNTSDFFGGGIAIMGASPIIANNTIVNGFSMYGGGFYISKASFPIIVNCILWGNNTIVGYGRQVHVFDSESQPKFMNCTFEQGAWDFQGSGYEGPYFDCIELDPKFIGIGQHPYMLSQNSPCVDAGILDSDFCELPELDLAGNQRILNGIVDMGAYESDYNVGITSNNPNTLNQIQLYYDYLTSEMTVFLPLFIGNAIIEIVDIKGNIVNCEKITPERIDNGKIQIKLSRRLDSGIFLGHVRSENFETTIKFFIAN